MDERIFPLASDDAEVVYQALRYYASDLVEAFVSDDDSPDLDEAAAAEDIARRLQAWLLTNRQSLVRDTSA